MSAFFVDFFASFLWFGYWIAKYTGDLTDEGFELNGWPAILLFLLIGAYFLIMEKYLGGTLGKRLFGLTKLRAKKMEEA